MVSSMLSFIYYAFSHCTNFRTFIITLNHRFQPLIFLLDTCKSGGTKLFVIPSLVIYVNFRTNIGLTLNKKQKRSPHRVSIKLMSLTSQLTVLTLQYSAGSNRCYCIMIATYWVDTMPGVAIIVKLQ